MMMMMLVLLVPLLVLVLLLVLTFSLLQGRVSDRTRPSLDAQRLLEAAVAARRRAQAAGRHQ